MVSKRTVRMVGAELGGLAQSIGFVEVCVEDGDWLSAVEVVRGMTNTLEALLEVAVAAAREAGETWEAIGERLGVSRQAVQQRYSGAALGC